MLVWYFLTSHIIPSAVTPLVRLCTLKMFPFTLHVPFHQVNLFQDLLPHTTLAQTFTTIDDLVLSLLIWARTS
jgi:hypothetical protein